MRMTTDGFSAVVAGLASAVRPSGALALVTEGGYDLEALEECLEVTLAAAQAQGPAAHPTARPAPRGERAILAVRAAQGDRWRL
jgi:acetoin utilization deacetylase AcuC-like enzyme